MTNQAQGYAVVRRYNEDTESPTRGYAKMVGALNNYEKAQICFEQLVMERWGEIQANLPEPTLWQKWKGISAPLDAFKDHARRGKVSEELSDTFVLFMKIHRGYLWSLRMNTYLCCKERNAFNGNTKVLPWLEEYCSLRKLIRNGEAWHLPERLCHFINHWTTHTSIYV